jgi:hypothetical protein
MKNLIHSNLLPGLCSYLFAGVFPNSFKHIHVVPEVVSSAYAKKFTNLYIHC